MAVETTPLGFQKPDGNDPIRNGDNVIAVNAQKSEDLLREARANIANLLSAAGFSGDPLDLNDAAVAEAVTVGSASIAALNAAYAPALVNSKAPVRKGDIVVSVSDYYPGGYVAGTTDVKSAFDAAVTAAPEGATVQFAPGATVFLTYGEPIKKALTIDCNGAHFTVDPTPGSGTAGKPVIYFEGDLSATAHAFGAVAQGVTSITLSTPANASAYARGDVILIQDQKQVRPWDYGGSGATPTYPEGYIGREEIATVKSSNSTTGVIQLLKPVEWDYNVTPTITRITKMLQAPSVVNIGSMTEVDPGGLNTSSLRGANAPHLVHFNLCHTPHAENLHFNWWNLHAINMYRCINPQITRSSGHDTYRPDDGGHGYFSRFDRCLGGSVTHTYTERVRHHTDYVMAYDASQAHNVAVSHVSAAYAGHGLGSKRITSDTDTVVDTGSAWGWMMGNGAFGPDYDFTIINPQYEGTSTAIMFHATAKNLRVVTPQLRTTGRCIIMTTGAYGLDIQGGVLETVGASQTANTVLVRPKEGVSDPYGITPTNFRMNGTKLKGLNPSVSVDATGSVILTDLISDEANETTVGVGINIVQLYSVPTSLRFARNQFKGVYSNALYFPLTAPTGEYTIEMNDIRGHTQRAFTLAVAANLKFIGNMAADNGSGLNPWNITGDMNAAKTGSNGYAAIILANSPATYDEIRTPSFTIGPGKMTLSGAAGTIRTINLQTAGVERWILRSNANAETGSDTGSDLELIARTDAGGAGPTLLYGKRTGELTVGAAGKSLAFFGNTPVTKPSVTGSRTGEPATVTSLRAALSNLGLITDSTTP